jgi:serine/threonine protein kinase
VELLELIGSHPHIISVIGKIMTPEDPMQWRLVFEIADMSLEDYLRDLKEPMGRVDSCRLLLQVADACRHMSMRNIVHRDLGARNILLLFQEGVAKIADFGLARKVDVASSASEKYDQPVYAQLHWGRLSAARAPEMANGITLLASDVFMFGWLMWEVAARGQEPPYATGFEPPPFQTSRRLVTLMEQCLLEDPEMRPDWRHVRTVLKEIIHDARSNPGQAQQGSFRGQHATSTSHQVSGLPGRIESTRA